MSINLTFSQEELDELERVLDDLAKRTLIEIRRSDNRDFRREIERRYQLRGQVLTRIRQAKQVAV